MTFHLKLALYLFLQEGYASSDPHSSLHGNSSMLHSLQEVVSGCAGLRALADWSALGPPDSKGILELQRACFWVEHLHGEAEINGNFLLQDEARQLSEEKEQVVRHNVLWFGNSNESHYPWLSASLWLLLCLLVIFVLEKFWLGTTVFPMQCVSHKPAKDDKKTDEKEALMESVSIDHSKCWNQLEEMFKTGAISESSAQEQTLLRFRERIFHAQVSAGKVGTAIIQVERTGPCHGEVKVQARTCDRTQDSFAAISGKNYSPTQVELVFHPGQGVALFEVPLLKTFCWESARWFRVELGPITAGKAKLYPQKHARVFISDDSLYPGNIPEALIDLEFYGIRRWLLAYYFMKECAAFRGQKFWKTFVAMMYKPFHDVVVSFLVQKFIISFVTKKEFLTDTYNGAMSEIVILAFVQLLSTCLLRWADVVQTRNRGRTGGIRQTHRLYLLGKMLLIGHQQHMRHESSQWVYAALYDVERVTMDIYWQFFVALQALESLFLSLLLIIFWDFAKIQLKGESYQISKLTPTLTCIAVIPVTTFLLWRRRTSVSDNVQKRADNEAGWVNIFSWLANASRNMYGLGYRELASIEDIFKKDNAKFVKAHQNSRDTMNDSLIISLWTTTISYLIILILGGFALLASNDNNNQKIRSDSGDYVLLLGLFSKFGKYMMKLDGCHVNFQRGIVSLKRIMKLLNLPSEKWQAISDRRGVHLSSKEETVHDYILLSSVRLEIPDKKFGFGPFGSVFTQEGCEIRFPLGRMVIVRSIHEARALSILAMAAGVVPPTSGEVHCPGYIWRAMLPLQPVESVGDLTCLGELLVTGASPQQADLLLRAVGIDPHYGAKHLPPGQVQLLVLLRGLLRDPEVLFLARPLAFVSPDLQKKAQMLIRLWQRCGGAEALLRFGENTDLSQPQAEAGSHLLPPQAEAGSMRRRTVIGLFHVVEHFDSDLVIDLDEYWDPHVGEDDSVLIAIDHMHIGKKPAASSPQCPPSTAPAVLGLPSLSPWYSKCSFCAPFNS